MNDSHYANNSKILHSTLFSVATRAMIKCSSIVFLHAYIRQFRCVSPLLSKNSSAIWEVALPFEIFIIVTIVFNHYNMWHATATTDYHLCVESTFNTVDVHIVRWRPNSITPLFTLTHKQLLFALWLFPVYFVFISSKWIFALHWLNLLIIFAFNDQWAR